MRWRQSQGTVSRIQTARQRDQVYQGWTGRGCLREVLFATGQGASDSTVLVFVVKDTGEGIAADRLDSIFEHFSHVNVQKMRVLAGTGLGLTITKQLVELMDGRIKV